MVLAALGGVSLARAQGIIVPSGPSTATFGSASYTLSTTGNGGGFGAIPSVSVAPGSYDVSCTSGLTPSCTATPDANGAFTVSGTPAPVAEVNLSLPAPILSGNPTGFASQNGTAKITYSYALSGLAAGGTDPGTIAVNLLAEIAGASSGAGTYAEVVLDNSATFVACAGQSSIFGPSGVVACTGQGSVNGTYNVTLQQTGQITLIASAYATAGGVAGGTALALADPVLTSADGYAITLSDGVANATIDAPEPASLLVLATGLAALPALRGRRPGALKR